MSWKESDHSLNITTPYPFLRSVKVNFAMASGKLHIIATGEWHRDLELIPMAYVGNESYIAEKAETEYVLGLFQHKYGPRHIEKYFTGTVVAYSLTPGTVSYRPETVIAKIFDGSSDTYEMDIRKDSTQEYMRAISGATLQRHYFKDAELMDLGAGVMFETRRYISKSRLSAVEGSSSFQELIRGQFTADEKENLEIYNSLSDAAVSGRKYDIIFSTFGYLELNSLEQTLERAKGMLNNQGIFIGAFWNSKGFIDNVFSMIRGNTEYVSGKREGLVPVGLSRYSLAAYTHKLSDFADFDGFSLEEVRGACFIIPPYNYRLSQKLSKNAMFRKLDEFLGKIPAFAKYSDFIILVLRKK